MPTYTYECTQGHEFDKRTTLAEAERTPLIPCPECEAKAKRVFRPFTAVNSTQSRLHRFRDRKRYTNW